VINAAAYTHTSVAIHDAIAAVSLPVIEVHISNVFARESFRQHSYVAPVAKASLCGFGIDGYALAITGLAAMIGAATTG
jgi:3-dehydroquinate dehydratase-2